MNFDSAVRFEAEKSRGKPSILWHQENAKKSDRKFGYTKKNLRHPVRKLCNREPAPTYNNVRNGKPPDDFIRKNRDSFGKSAINGTDSKISPSTITLTQEQLNAILASVGRLNSSDKENELHLTIDNENNEIHIRKSPRVLTSPENAQNGADANILSLDYSDRQHDTDARILNGNYSDSSMRDMEREKFHLESGDPTNNYATKEPGAGMDLPPLVHKQHMTLGERKRLQWARERGEMQQQSDPWSRQGSNYHNTSALSGPFYTESSFPSGNITSAPGSRRGVTDQTPASMKSVIEQTPPSTKGGVDQKSRPVESMNGEKADTYDPWGKPGGGARHNPVVKPDGQDPATKLDFMGRPIMDYSSTQDMYTVRNRQPQTGLDQKKEWMTELEKQMEEQKQRKMKERDMEKSLGDMSWLDRFTNDHKPVPLPEQLNDVQSRLSKLDVV